ncbi:MAG: hypothetical protein GY765_07460 [bacterium]|nr:hypothetical protein [bacterium]
MTFTVFNNAFDVNGEKYTLDWSEWTDIFKEHDVRGSPADTESVKALDAAKDGPCVILAELDPQKTRSIAAVLEANALSIDLDHCNNQQLDTIFDILSQYTYCLYSTHKSGCVALKGALRLRVVLPLAEPIQPASFASAWIGLNRLIGGHNDPQTKDISRLNYLPSTFDPSHKLYHENPGTTWISLLDLHEHTYADIELIEELDTVRRGLKALRKDHPSKEAATALLEKQPFAEVGNGCHAVVLALTMLIAKKNKALPETALEALFSPSLAKMPGYPLAKAVAAYDGACTRLKSFQTERYDNKIQQVTQGAGTYTEEDLKNIAANNSCTVTELRDRWILQKDGSGWILTETGKYAGPYTVKDIPLAISKHLARAPVRLFEMQKNGMVYRSSMDVVRESGSLIDKLYSDMTIQQSVYHPDTREFYEACTPLRPHEPAFNPKVDQWLKLLTGEHYEKVIDWLSVVSDLTQLLCAIYFDGPKGSGKSLFAFGVAKLWTVGAPADLEKSILADFTEDLTRCPLVLADEAIPKKKYSSGTVTAKLRSELSVTDRPLTRKYLPVSPLRGAIRLIMSANNSYILDNRDVSTAMDLDAIAQRFLYVKVPGSIQDCPATDFMLSLSKEEVFQWLHFDIAKHVLWLRENHVRTTKGGRFAVEGDITSMHRMVMLGSKWNSLAAEWLVRYLLEPRLYEGQRRGLCRRGDGRLLVNNQAVIDGWTMYHKNILDRPDTAKIGMALSALSKSDKPIQRKVQGHRVRFWDIDIDHLIAWSERFGIGDKETLEGAIEGAVKEEAGTVTHLPVKGAS